MRKQKLERAVVLSLMLAALQQNSVLAGDAISKEEYTGDKDKYYSYQDAVSIDKFVESQFSYKAASAVSAGSTGGNGFRIELSFDKNLTVDLDDPTAATDKDVYAVRAGNYATINIGGELLSITNNAIHSDPNDYTVNYGIYGSQTSKINITAQNTEINLGGNSQGKDETYNATGIYNAGIENYGGDFLAKNLKITGMMQGNFIGINNSGKFAADNIDIQAVSESGSMYGIKNTGTGGLDFKDVNIELELKSGYALTGIKSKSNLTADNINIKLQNGNTGLYVTDTASAPDLLVKGALNIDIVTNSESAVGAYAKGKLTVGKELNVFIDGSKSFNVNGIVSDIDDGMTDAKDNVKMVLIGPRVFYTTYVVGFTGNTLLEGRKNDLLITLDQKKGAAAQGRAAIMGDRITGSMGSLETGNGSETNIMINAKPAGGVNRSKLIQGV